MNLKDFYTKKLTVLENEISQQKKMLFRIAMVRFVFFILTIFGIYFVFDYKIIAGLIALVGISIFVWLILKHIKLQREKAIINAKININRTEILVLNNDFSQLENGKEFVDAAHFYSNDIDLFGERSFFQFINRTKTLKGKIKLASILTANSTDHILDKQNAIKELAPKVSFRQHFNALASLDAIKTSPNFIIQFILKYKSVFPNFLKRIPVVFSIISLLIIGLVSFSILSFSILVIWFFIGIFITGRFIKKTNQLYTETNKISKTFQQYYPLLQQIENEKFSSEILVKQQQIINSEEKKASIIFKEFSKTLDAFDNRNNIIIAVFGNGLFLTEINNAIKVEKWITTNKNVVEKWFEVVAFFDAQISLANFYFNHPKFTFPELSTTETTINSNNLGHPLLQSKKRVDNDFTIENGNFFIVTGANMAGKSTFLRTVSLSIVMANCGLPVCATSFKYSPIKLITSMRTSDNLSEDESYFYSELKRLKFIVDEIASEKYFIILDEILKGTNSKDKAIGSKKFVEKLSKSNSTGIIATHDVSLCALEDEFSTIKNYFFEAEINENELSFDYKLKIGICKNMNASFLLKKMEII